MNGAVPRGHPTLARPTRNLLRHMRQARFNAGQQNNSSYLYRRSVGWGLVKKQ
jgi:hypothetical protein